MSPTSQWLYRNLVAVDGLLPIAAFLHIFDIFSLFAAFLHIFELFQAAFACTKTGIKVGFNLHTAMPGPKTCEGRKHGEASGPDRRLESTHHGIPKDNTDTMSSGVTVLKHVEDAAVNHGPIMGNIRSCCC